MQFEYRNFFVGTDVSRPLPNNTFAGIRNLSTPPTFQLLKGRDTSVPTKRCHIPLTFQLLAGRDTSVPTNSFLCTYEWLHLLCCLLCILVGDSTDGVDFVLKDAAHDGDATGVGRVHAKVGETARAKIFAARIGRI